MGSQQLDDTQHVIRGGEKVAGEAEDYVFTPLCTAGSADDCETAIAE